MPVTATPTRPAKRTTTRHTIIRHTIMPVIIMAMVITTTTATIITMTSIASMTITTAIPMLMNTNKPPGKRRSVVPEAVGSSAAPVSGRADPGPADMPESEAASLYRLMTWLSPSFPVGALLLFQRHRMGGGGRRRHGRRILAGLARLHAGGRRWDSATVSFWRTTHRAASSGDDACAGGYRRACFRLLPSRERHLETTAQGRAFIEIARAAWSIALAGSAGRVVARRLSSIRSRSASSAPRTRFRSRPRSTPSCMR